MVLISIRQLVPYLMNAGCRLWSVTEGFFSVSFFSFSVRHLRPLHFLLEPGSSSDFNYLFLVKDLLSFLLAVHSFKPVRQTLAGPSARAFHVLATR